jgi:hypothetical protein
VRSILACCRDAIPETARLVVAEIVVWVGDRIRLAKWFDLLMLVYSRGRERTEAQYADLLTSIGFAINRSYQLLRRHPLSRRVRFMLE